MTRKGKITTDYYITCGQCEYGQHVGETRYALALETARELGWRRVSDSWTCPDCMRRRASSHLPEEGE